MRPDHHHQASVHRIGRSRRFDCLIGQIMLQLLVNTVQRDSLRQLNLSSIGREVEMNEFIIIMNEIRSRMVERAGLLKINKG